MIGDRETPREEITEELPPLDHVVRLNPPPVDPPLPPAWVERHGRIVVIRHTWPSGEEGLTERVYPTVGKALIGYATQVSFLRHRGYTDADPGW
jgi:hypothetical protein